MSRVNRILRVLFKTAVVLLLLPLMLVIGIFLYVKFVNPGAEQTMQEMTEFLEQRKSPGNGFGGEAGLQIMDSDYQSERFFWIDSNHLVFQTRSNVYFPEKSQKVFVWDLASNTIKPLPCDCSIQGFRENALYFLKKSTADATPEGILHADRFSAELRELDDRWAIDGEVNISETLELPSDKYGISWMGESVPSFRLRQEFRSKAKAPDHRFLHLPEWGWILRMPRTGPDYWDQSIPEMGFIDLGDEIYAEQPGIKVGEMIGLHPREYPDLRIVYVAYLDRYWLANTVYGDLSLTRAMGFISPEGVFTAFSWPDSWPQYSGIPMPTKKGIFWSGKDYREKRLGGGGKGAFIRDAKGHVHKVIQGTAIALKMSPDGCEVAFFNTLSEEDRSKSSLKNFRVCSSTIKNEVIEDVKY